MAFCDGFKLLQHFIFPHRPLRAGGTGSGARAPCPIALVSFVYDIISLERLKLNIYISDSTPVNGNWTDWSFWAACTVTCGDQENKNPPFLKKEIHYFPDHNKN